MITKTFKPWRVVAIRNWDGAMRATRRTTRSCDGPRGSLSMWSLGLVHGGWLANAHSRRGGEARALVSLASIAE